MKKDKSLFKLNEIKRYGAGFHGGSGYDAWNISQQKRYNAKVAKYEAKERKYKEAILKLQRELEQARRGIAPLAQPRRTNPCVGM